MGFWFGHGCWQIGCWRGHGLLVWAWFLAHRLLAAEVVGTGVVGVVGVVGLVVGLVVGALFLILGLCDSPKASTNDTCVYLCIYNILMYMNT